MFKQKPVESDSHLLDIQQVVEAESELWDACAEEREHFDTLFYQLTSGQDYLSGDKAKDFFKKSELPHDELLKFWNLVDFNKDGQLDKKEFGIACYLIKKVITEGQNLPGSLPTSLFESDVTMRTATATSSRPRSTLDKQQKSFNILISGSFKVIKLYDLKTFKLLKQFEGHKKDISSLKIINENTLASGSHDTMIKIWNIETGDCVQTLENHQWSVTNLETFHSDEEQLLISGSHSEIKIWSTNSGKCLKTLIEYATGIQHLKLLNNDHLASGDSEGLIKIWNLTTKKCVNNIEAHKGILAAHSVKCLQRISDEIVASGSKDRKIKLWNFKTNKCVNTLEGVFQSHTATVRCLSLMSDDVLCSGSSDKTVKIWNLKTSKCLKTLKGHLDKVTCLQVFNVSLVSGSDDTTIKIWNIITGECISTIQNGNPVTCLQILTI